MISAATPNVTSSPGSACGPTPFAVPDGRTTSPSGLGPARASLSARQAKEQGLLTSGTYGPLGSTSSASAALASSLVSRLKRLSALAGSTLFTLTWKEKATPSGRLVSLLRGSARRISAKGSGSSESEKTGWPSPMALSGGPSKDITNQRGVNAGNPLATATAMAAWPSPGASDGNGGKGPRNGVSMTGRMPDGSKVTMGLPAVAKLALSSWPTPQSRDGSHGGGQANRAMGEGRHGSNLDDFAMAAGWPTTRATDGNKGSRTLKGCEAEIARKGNLDDLPSTAIYQMSGWPTPMAGTAATETYNEAGNTDSGRKTAFLAGAEIKGSGIEPLENWGPARRTVTGQLLTGSSAGMASGGQLRAAHSRWLMGLPRAWDDCAPRPLPKRRKL